MKKIFGVFLIFVSFGISINYHFDGSMWKEVKNLTNNKTKYVLIEPVSDKIVCKQYKLENVTNLTNENPFLFVINKENNNFYEVCLNTKNILLLVLITLFLLDLAFLITRLIHIIFKEKKDKHMLFNTILSYIFAIILVMISVMFYLPLIGFLFRNAILSFLVYVTFINAIFIFLFYLVYFAIDMNNPLKNAFFTFLVSMFPMEVLVFLVSIILTFADYLGIAGFILIYVIIQLFIAEYYHKFIIKLSTWLRSKPLKIYEKENEIKKTFSGYCDVNHVYVIDSPAANAFAVGLIKKDIYLTSKLIEEFNEDEIKAVIAHEVGHHYHKHLIKLFTLIVGLYLLIKLLPIPLVIKSFLYIFYVLFVLFGLGFIQNRFEYEADEFAAKTVGLDPTVSSLEKLAVINKIPKKTGKFFNILFKHPSIEERIENLKKKFNS